MIPSGMIPCGMIPCGLIPSGMVTVRRAIEEDVPFIMAAERLPGYDAFIGTSDAARHQARLLDERHAVFLALDDAENPNGFAILGGWNSADRVTLLFRIAMTHPGAGHGKSFLRQIIDLVFIETHCHRFCLGQFPGNARARHVYESAGFIAEGIARGNVFLNGTHHDELIMAILRPEWLANRQTG